MILIFIYIWKILWYNHIKNIKRIQSSLRRDTKPFPNTRYITKIFKNIFWYISSSFQFYINDIEVIWPLIQTHPRAKIKKLKENSKLSSRIRDSQELRHYILIRWHTMKMCQSWSQIALTLVCSVKCAIRYNITLSSR